MFREAEHPLHQFGIDFPRHGDDFDPQSPEAPVARPIQTHSLDGPLRFRGCGSHRSVGQDFDGGRDEVNCGIGYDLSLFGEIARRAAVEQIVVIQCAIRFEGDRRKMIDMKTAE